MSRQGAHVITQTLGSLSTYLGRRLIGDPDVEITCLQSIDHAQPGALTFLRDRRKRHFLKSTQASAVILSEVNVEFASIACLISDQPHYDFSRVAQLYAHVTKQAPGIDALARVDERCDIHPTASIGPYCVIGEGVCIGPGVYVGPHCTIGPHVEIGEDTRLSAGVIIHHHVRIGQRCVIQSSAVIGGEGFGLVHHEGRWHAVPQLATVLIQDDVEIGASTTIDRGALTDTVLGTGVKLDNQIQVGHAATIGQHTVIAGCVGIGGGAQIGQHCMIGGQCAISDHVTITDHVVIHGDSRVSSSIFEPGEYGSGTDLLPARIWRRTRARFKHLNQLFGRVKQLEDSK